MDRERQSPDAASPKRRAPSEIAALAGELAELGRNAPARLTERMSALSVADQAELALRIPARERLELLLHAPRPMRLVRALPDFEFYMTVREVGPADALPLFALGSADQIRHLVDLESWRGEEFDALRCGGWVALLLDAGEAATVRFLRGADDELLALLFQQWARVQAIEPEDGPEVHGAGHTETGDELGRVSPDGNHRFAPVIPEHGPAVGRLMQILYRDQPERYVRLLNDAVWELRLDLEESALRWRRSRLEEHGFPPWDEALAVYAQPEGVRSLPRPPEPADPEGLTAPRTPLLLLVPDSALPAALEGLPETSRERVLHELLSVANRLLVADGADTGDPESHRSALRKAAAATTVALEARSALEPQRARDALERTPLIELFREGHARAVEVQQTARALVRSGWAASHPRALQLLDPPVREHVEALLAPRPLHFAAGAGGGEARVRAFRSLQEIEQARLSVQMAELTGRLLLTGFGVALDRLFEAAEAERSDPPRLSAFLLTLLAWNATRGELRVDPLSDDVAAEFVRGYAASGTAAPGAADRALEALWAELTREARLSSTEVALLRSFGRACLERLAAECGTLDPDRGSDLRRIGCLRL